MKLFTATSIMLASSSGFAKGALPPGLQDQMHCPEGSCSLYIEQPLGFAGPRSAFYKCLDMETNELIDAVWTGSLTDVVPPQGWVEDPEDCDSIPDDEDDDEDDDADDDEDEEEPINLDSPGGVCFDDSDCYTRIRSAIPVNSSFGPEICGCYAASEVFPWDETEGEEHFRRARCQGNECDGYEAFCTLAPDDNGVGECALRPIESPSSTQEEDEDTSNKIVSPTPAPPAPRSAASSSEDTDSEDDESNQSPPAAVM
jgi:hypothetical protein